MKISKDSIVGDLVSENYKTAAVFNNFKIDFCCNGNLSITDAALKANVKVENVITALKELPKENSGDHVDYRSWPLDLLVDYIEKKHHRYVEQQILNIKPILEKVASVHGNEHPELDEIKRLFDESADEFTMHMKKEELMLFPYIKRLVKTKSSGEPLKAAPFGEVRSPIAKMMEEHDQEGGRFRTINELSNAYELPVDACNSYAVCYKLLQEFEEDLHHHIHLENNILFPAAEKLEKELMA